MRITYQTISLEAAELLGVPFTWGSCEHACKFVHTADGPTIMVKNVEPKYDALLGREWQESETVRRILERRPTPLYLVELDEETTDALHR